MAAHLVQQVESELVLVLGLAVLVSFFWVLV